MVTECGEKETKTINMKDSSKIIESKDMGSILGAVEMSIKGTTTQICDMEAGRCIGLMVVFIKETGLLTNPMEKGSCLMGIRRSQAFSKMGSWLIWRQKRVSIQDLVSFILKGSENTED